MTGTAPPTEAVLFLLLAPTVCDTTAGLAVAENLGGGGLLLLATAPTLAAIAAGAVVELMMLTTDAGASPVPAGLTGLPGVVAAAAAVKLLAGAIVAVTVGMLSAAPVPEAIEVAEEAADRATATAESLVFAGPVLLREAVDGTALWEASLPSCSAATCLPLLLVMGAACEVCNTA